MMHRVMSVFVCAVLGIAALAACSHTPSKEKSVLHIGVTLPLSGVDKERGDAAAAALDLVAEQLNDADTFDDYTLKLLRLDTASSPDTAADEARKLMERDDVAAVVSIGSDDVNARVTAVAEEHSVPTVVTSTLDTQGEEQRPHIFSTVPRFRAVCDAIVRDLTQRDIASVAFLFEDAPYGKAGQKSCVQRIENSDIDVLMEESLGERDDSSQTALSPETLRDVLRHEVTSVIVWATHTTASPSASAIRDGIESSARTASVDGFEGDIYVASDAESGALVQEIGEDIQKIHSVYPSILTVHQRESNTPNMLRQKRFFSQYIASYGRFSSTAPYAADALGVIVAAVQKLDSPAKTQPDQVRDALEDLTYEGLAGKYRFTQENHAGLRSGALRSFTASQGTWV